MTESQFFHVKGNKVSLLYAGSVGVGGVAHHADVMLLLQPPRFTSHSSPTKDLRRGDEGKEMRERRERRER